MTEPAVIGESVTVLSRRICLIRCLAPSAWFLTTTVTTDSAASATTSSLSSVEEICQNGALAPEQAVPGAYQQACMALPTRTIRIRQPPTRGSQKSFVDLHVQQQAGTSMAGSTGTVIWNSSLLLSRLLQRVMSTNNIDSDYNPLTVLELGCGTGLVSLTAAITLPNVSRVIATDGNPNVVELAKENIEQNRLSGLVETAVLNWGLLPAMDFVDTADLVLGSDLTYLPGNWPVLAETMSTVLRDKGRVLYLSLGHSGFNVNAELEGFLSVAAGYGLVRIVDDECWTERYLTNLLFQELTPEERSLVQTSGGVRVVALGKKARRR